VSGAPMFSSICASVTEAFRTKSATKRDQLPQPCEGGTIPIRGASATVVSLKAEKHLFKVTLGMHSKGLQSSW